MPRVHRHWGKSNTDLTEMLALASYLMGRVPSAKALREREHEALRGLPGVDMYVRRFEYWKNAQDAARVRFEELRREAPSPERAWGRLRALVEGVADEPQGLKRVGGTRKPAAKKKVAVTLEAHQVAHLKTKANASAYLRALIEEDMRREATSSP